MKYNELAQLVEQEILAEAPKKKKIPKKKVDDITVSNISYGMLAEMIESEMIEAAKPKPKGDTIDFGGKVHEVIFGWELAQLAGVEFYDHEGKPFTQKGVEEHLGTLPGYDKISDDEWNDQFGRAENAAKKFVASDWNKEVSGGNISSVWWASTGARLRGALATVLEQSPGDLKIRKSNPTDVLVGYAGKKALGVSLKSTTKLTGAVPMGNPGTGDLSGMKKESDKFQKKFIKVVKGYKKFFELSDGWPKTAASVPRHLHKTEKGMGVAIYDEILTASSAKARKKAIQSLFKSPGKQKPAELTKLSKFVQGKQNSDWLQKFFEDVYGLRNTAFKAYAKQLSKTNFEGKDYTAMRKELLDNWLKYFPENFPEYVIVTGRGQDGNYAATIKDTKTDPVTVALTTADEINWALPGQGYSTSPGKILIWAKKGNEEFKLFDIVFKYESTPFASTLKISVEGASGKLWTEKDIA